MRVWSHVSYSRPRYCAIRSKGKHSCRIQPVIVEVSARVESFSDFFTVESKIVGWDQRAFYLEQKFLSNDNFVHCHSYSILKLSSRGKASETSPIEILSNVAKLDIKSSNHSLVELHTLPQKHKPSQT